VLFCAGASTSVRLIDGLLDEYVEANQWQGVTSNTPPKTKNDSFILSACQQASVNFFSFEPRSSTDKPIANMVPKRLEVSEYLKQANMAFADATKIAHYTF